MPTNIVVIEKNIEKTMYTVAKPKAPDSINLKHSKPKVEKVENPPQKPITRKYFNQILSPNSSKSIPVSNPKISEAKMFAKKVALGNPSPSQGKVRERK